MVRELDETMEEATTTTRRPDPHILYPQNSALYNLVALGRQNIDSEETMTFDFLESRL
jgi:hypothetical protein